MIKTVLLAEKNEAMAKIFRLIVSSSSIFASKNAENGENRWIRAVKPEEMMPGDHIDAAIVDMDGYAADFIKDLRRRFPQLSVMVTGTPEDISAGFGEGGAVMAVAKPFDPQKIADFLELCLKMD